MTTRDPVEPVAVNPLRLVMADDLCTLTDYAAGLGAVANTLRKLALRCRAGNGWTFPDPVKSTSFTDIYLASELDAFFSVYIPWARARGTGWTGKTPEERDA